MKDDALDRILRYGTTLGVLAVFLVHVAGYFVEIPYAVYALLLVGLVPPAWILLEGLAVGVDNLRHDVALSPRFVEMARAQVMRLIVRHGELEGLLAAESPHRTQGPSWMRNAVGGSTRNPGERSDWKPLLAELHLAALNRAKKKKRFPSTCWRGWP